ncbi:MAG: CHAT domain-containing protein [Candidatus Hinthialibacter antarcticus]|nr:CHAT domain-containing protein [Candidatus Hinthialibacter antarcticus]
MGEIRLNWSFGEPHENDGGLAVDFYYQTGKHISLQFAWPTRRFTGAGNLPLQTKDVSSGAWFGAWDRQAQETGRRLYELLGAEAQKTLIHTFANLQDDESDRALVLQFPIPSHDAKERCLALEDLPWELLHDGETYLSWRYGLQIIRSHTRDSESINKQKIDVSTWGVILATPFATGNEEALQKIGLPSLPHSVEEIEMLRSLQDWSGGLIRIWPSLSRRRPGGVKTVAQLDAALRSSQGGPKTILHFIGHGVMVDDEPCLCFEDDKGDPDYVSVSRLRTLLTSVQESAPKNKIPAIFFLNACGSSSRGRYSAGFASGLHDLGLCVLGYQAEIEDNDKPILAARRFYQSLCIDQSLQTPHLTPTIVGAVEAARRSLRGPDTDTAPLWGRFRAYIPPGIEFIPRGRGFMERTVQSMYTRFADWLNPSDYTDHLSLGFIIALLSGVLLGVQNLAFILPETVDLSYLTYGEIISELIRIFLIGPLSFLGASLFAAWLTRRNHQKIIHRAESSPASSHDGFPLMPFPLSLFAGAAFGFGFSYSFSRLDLLTAQVVGLANLTTLSAPVFWYGLVGCLSLCLALLLSVSSIYHIRRRDSLHSYGTFYFLSFAILCLITLYVLFISIELDIKHYRKIGWLAGCVAIITIFALSTIKIVKETSWRASKKRKPLIAFSWRKFWPLVGSAILVAFCYIWLEQSARFPTEFIRQTILQRNTEIQADQRTARVIQILERALRQRAVSQAPESLRANAHEDWLLSIVYADSALYQYTQEGDQDLLMECEHLLRQASSLNQEATVRDYRENIAAMVNILRADFMDSNQEKQAAYGAAVKLAERAVAKDPRNFAYLDTLARAEAKLAVLTLDLHLLRKAQAHARQAQWSAFFLRSPRADGIRASIDQLAVFIEEQLHQLTSGGAASGA